MRTGLFIIMSALLIATLIAVPAKAVLVKETCFNESHLRVTYDFTLSEDASDTAYNYSQLHWCTNNCSLTLNKCIGTLDSNDLAGPAIISGAFAILFMILGVTFSSEHGPLQILFTFIGFILVLNTSNMLYQIARANSAPTSVLNIFSNQIWILAITFWVFAAYFMIKFLQSVLESFGIGSEKD